MSLDLYHLTSKKKCLPAKYLLEPPFISISFKKETVKIPLHFFYSVLRTELSELEFYGSFTELPFDIAETSFFTLHDGKDKKFSEAFCMHYEQFGKFRKSLEEARAHMMRIVDRYLIVSVPKADHLKAMDRGGVSDPYCRLEIQNDGKTVQGSALFTTIHYKTVNPRWGFQKFIFPLDETMTGLRVVCLDYDKFLSSEVEGECIVELSSIPLNQDVFRPFNLGGEKDNRGEIFLELKLVDSNATSDDVPATVVTPSLKPAPLSRLESTQQDFVMFNAGQLKLHIEYTAPKGDWQGNLIVTVLEGRNLVAKDENGYSDPYVVLRLKGSEQKVKTRYLERTLSPVWKKHNSFSFPVKSTSAPPVLHAEAWDYDVLSANDFMGVMELVVPEGVSTKWYDLEYAPDKAPVMTSTSFGKKLRAKWVPDYPIMLIPGFASTALEVKQSSMSGWSDLRVWLGLSSIISSSLKEKLPHKKKAKTMSLKVNNLPRETLGTSTLDLSGASDSDISDSNDNDHDGSQDDGSASPTYRRGVRIGQARTGSRLGDRPRAASRPVPLRSLSTSSDVVGGGEDQLPPPPKFDLSRGRPSEKLVASTNVLTDEQVDNFRNQWVSHMCLAPDCRSDPPGIVVRPVNTIDGCTYLQTGSMGKSMSYVLGPLINNLEAMGYEVDQNLFAQPYDWRIPPSHLEERDGYFTNLMQTITLAHKKNQNKGVVLVGHSMGCRTIQYFLNWVKDRNGVEWIDKYIHKFVAVGAPWLGSPKMLRALISGERMGLEALLSREDSIQFSRRVGSTMSLLPIRVEEYFSSFAHCGIDAKSFVHLKAESKTLSPSFVDKKNRKYQALNHDNIFDNVGVPKHAALYEKYYTQDPCYGGMRESGKERILDAPPVKRLVNVYGVNLDTEKFYFYRTKRQQLILDKKCSVNLVHHKLKGGIAYETDETPQVVLAGDGIANSETFRSGDGTVTYESLNFATTHWKKKIPELTTYELPNCEHRDTISTSVFLKVLVQNSCKKIAHKSSARKPKRTLLIYGLSGVGMSTLAKRIASLNGGGEKGVHHANVDNFTEDYYIMYKGEEMRISVALFEGGQMFNLNNLNIIGEVGCIALVYDLSDRDSVRPTIQAWKTLKLEIPVALVGTHADMEREVPEAFITRTATRYNFSTFEIGTDEDVSPGKIKELLELVNEVDGAAEEKSS